MIIGDYQPRESVESYILIRIYVVILDRLGPRCSPNCVVKAGCPTLVKSLRFQLIFCEGMYLGERDKVIRFSFEGLREGEWGKGAG